MKYEKEGVSKLILLKYDIFVGESINKMHEKFRKKP